MSNHLIIILNSVFVLLEHSVDFFVVDVVLLGFEDGVLDDVVKRLDVFAVLCKRHNVIAGKCIVAHRSQNVVFLFGVGTYVVGIPNRVGVEKHEHACVCFVVCRCFAVGNETVCNDERFVVTCKFTVDEVAFEHTLGDRSVGERTRACRYEFASVVGEICEEGTVFAFG